MKQSKTRIERGSTEKKEESNRRSGEPSERIEIKKKRAGGLTAQQPTSSQAKVRGRARDVETRQQTSQFRNCRPKVRNTKMKSRGDFQPRRWTENQRKWPAVDGRQDVCQNGKRAWESQRRGNARRGIREAGHCSKALQSCASKRRSPDRRNMRRSDVVPERDGSCRNCRFNGPISDVRDRSDIRPRFRRMSKLPDIIPHCRR